VGEAPPPPRSPARLRREILLRMLLHHPFLVAEATEEIAEIDFPEPELDILRREILQVEVLHPGLDASGLRQHLERCGFAATLDGLLSPSIDHAGFLGRDGDDEAVRQGWLHVLRMIGEENRSERASAAEALARLARIDPELLYPVKHRSVQAQADLTLIRARAGLVRARTGLVNAVRGLAKSYGERLRGCNVRNMNPEKAESLSPELQAALEPLLNAIESLSERIEEYNERIEDLAQQRYRQVALLKQIKGVGTLIALTYMLTLEDPHRFRKSRDVGGYLGLQPGRRNSGQSEPQLHIKEGDPYLRTLLVQGAQHILGPFGPDCDLRRWGLKLAERGGRNGKKRAIVATARKLAVLLHHLWVSGEAYEPLHNSKQKAMPTAA